MSEVPSIRLYVDAALAEGAVIECDRAQANYLLNVLRLNEGREIALFNGRDGEWRARVERQGRKSALLSLVAQLRPQEAGPDLHYLFAPLKKARLDYMVQKAVELGASRLTPVLTEYCQVERVNLERMRANAIEAAEQCGLISLPLIDSPVKLVDLIGEWDKNRSLVFCNEKHEISGPVADLEGLQGGKMAVLIGPEGGFSPQEALLLQSQEFVTSISLGPRIMRADTAAVAALSLVNAVLGDWRPAD
ncbi:MAG: ribosomal RNA small subunit methyltransferase E [Rhodomicrobium sp.]|nr:MAG: ribosomal RNA small subunit methyltransferase E [Rhodomicrobium sp.]